MFLSKPTRLGPASKARLNILTNPHQKLDPFVDSGRLKKSPDGNSHPPTPTSPSEVLVFNNMTQQGATRSAHFNRNIPEVPNLEEIEQFMKDSWDERIRRINDPSLNLRVLWLKSYAEEERERQEAEAAGTASASSTHGSNISSGSTKTRSNNSKNSSASSTPKSQSPIPPANSSTNKKKGSPNHGSRKN